MKRATTPDDEAPAAQAPPAAPEHPLDGDGRWKIADAVAPEDHDPEADVCPWAAVALIDGRVTLKVSDTELVFDAERLAGLQRAVTSLAGVL